MALQMGMEEYVERTMLYNGKRVEVECLKGNLVVSLKEDVKEISVVVVGPRTLVGQVVIEEQEDSLLIVQSSVDSFLPDSSVITINPEGNFKTEVMVTITIPLGIFIVLDDIKGFVRIKYGETNILSFSN